MVIGDRRLYWAGGRLLPKEDLSKADSFRPYVDYLYPRVIPDPATFSPETVAGLSNQVLAEQRKNAPAYDMAFYDALYDGATRVKIESHIVRIDYLGKRVSVWDCRAGRPEDASGNAGRKCRKARPRRNSRSAGSSCRRS